MSQNAAGAGLVPLVTQIFIGAAAATNQPGLAIADQYFRRTGVAQKSHRASGAGVSARLEDAHQVAHLCRGYFCAPSQHIQRCAQRAHNIYFFRRREANAIEHAKRIIALDRLAQVAGGGKMMVHSAIDNLLKGASGQAVQNMNIMFGLEETAGLRLKANYF